MRRQGLQLRWDPVRKLQVPVIPEQGVVEEIITRLWLQAKIRVVIINQPVGGKTPPNESGIPDLVGWIPCKLPSQRLDSGDEKAIPLFIEAKRLGGARRPAQIRFITEAKADGCAAFFAESWLDVVRELSPFGVHLKA